MNRTNTEVFKLSEHITLVPVLHGSADWALNLRKLFFENNFDAVAIPLPPSFQGCVEDGIKKLPQLSLAIQKERYDPSINEAESENARASYVPIDPCQGVIQVIRLAIQERTPRFYIDLETNHLMNWHPISPDPYALKKVGLDQFCASLLPHIPAPNQQAQERVQRMSHHLHDLESKYKNVLALCSLEQWPWLRSEYQKFSHENSLDDIVNLPVLHGLDPKTAIFMLGELPFITWLHERSRQDFGDDDNLSIDGIKELLIETRTRYQQDLGKRARPITPQALTTFLKYVRNLSLIDHRLTPDLYSLALAAQQIFGDQFAMHLVKMARDYPEGSCMQLPSCTLGIDHARLPSGETVELVSRLPGVEREWRSLELKPIADKKLRDMWEMKWNPHAQCSWPAEDQSIENFRNSVMERAAEIIGQDLARSEKFTTSVQDGLDIRETLRNWHTGNIYVKIYPPARGKLDATIMFFDTPADPRDYPWRTTWMAEHEEESTLCFYATDFSKDIVGPGIGLATYGGALFLYPPRVVSDVWSNPLFDFSLTLEDRLVAAGCFYSQSNHVALLSPQPPGVSWRQIAKQFGKKLVHIPLGKFGESTIAQLRLVHVLNGKEVRSFASHFIRKA